MSSTTRIILASTGNSQLVKLGGPSHRNFPDKNKQSYELPDINNSPAKAKVNEIEKIFASCRISAMVQDDGLNYTNRILLAVRNMVEKLPRHTVEDGPRETELITRHLEAILAPLFEDLDNNIIFRWTSVSDEEKQATTRPDASINITNGASFTVGNHNYADDSFTLTDNMLHNATDPKSSRKRKSITSHYNH
ncbi:hypothetical protein EDC94DRAFT_689989 [Helicostylum pulchrum]|nr:hypothetical protein EDC94DRAFT_689989 [Helicostylum pulchrum]